MMQEVQEDKQEVDGKKRKRPQLKKILLSAALVLVAALLVGTSYVFAVSPGAIRNPQIDHYHFRMQVVVDGQSVDFSKQSFQTTYAKGQCSGDLPTEPFHFHDQKDQFAHVHWKGMTGGMVLKNYGWNFIGGSNSSLGYRLDNFPRVQSVPIHGKDLPKLPADAQLWVYTGDENGYQKRSLDDFKNQQLETFFNKKSNLTSSNGSSLASWLFPKASAHGAEHHHTDETGQTEAEHLAHLNNHIGNVVIFVQKSEPTAEQIKIRFAHLEPLSDSICGG